MTENITKSTKDNNIYYRTNHTDALRTVAGRKRGDV